ncbi:cytochrome d ubiquinol oxidase subunit II [Aeromicrobium alkaliterrae]|uniref:Cytochrome d ubiquinol oxidase subunit II n=1 Tax=Aeromicrobium alkaliterrae TaxID=302168 RepID=A0ABN2JMF8_9ACTN
MELTTVWFVLIAVLWIGYLVLEGFDFGVGILTRVLARDDRERRVLLNTIGPVWDGNEVWLIVAGGATFAAFPEWYATLFSAYYLPLFVILLALIVRAVGFEYRHKRTDEAWKRGWDHAIFWGSAVPAVLWGVVLAGIVHGIPLNASHDFTGTILDLFTPYALLGGLVTLSVFVTHGSFFIALKTVGDIRHRARTLGLRWGLVAAASAVAFIGWTAARDGDLAVWVAGGLGALSFVGGMLAGRAGREGWAFTGTAFAIIGVAAMLFLALFPDVMPSTLATGTLTTTNAASTPYTLEIMTWVAAAFTPIVIGYQAWSYWVFRRRIGVHHIPA